MADTPNIPSPEGNASKTTPASDLGRVLFVPRGIFASRRQRVCVDFESETISKGDIHLPFSSIEILELHSGVFGASDGKQWVFFDSVRYRDLEGTRLIDPSGGLSERFSKVLYEVQGVVSSSQTSHQVEPAYNFRYLVHLDYSLVFLTLVGFALFLGFEYSLLGHFPLAELSQGTGLFLGLLLFFVAVYVFWRWSSTLRCDANGIRMRRAFFERRAPWERVTGVRHQGLEVELEGQGIRMSFNLGVLAGLGSPLVVLRGRRPVLTPLGARFLRWVCSRAPMKEERSVFGTPAQRHLSRMWVLILVVVNAGMFALSKPPSFFGPQVTEEQWREFHESLIMLGARTSEAFEEPWRFLTALFLHGDALHLGFNMLVLASLAPWLIRIFGWWRGTFLYLASGVLGNFLAQIWQIFSPSEAVLSIGSSTAILGIIGAFLGAVYRRPLSVPLAVRARFRWAIPVVVLLTVVQGLAIPILDNASHLGGFTAGFALVWLVPPVDR